jgi:predicted nucleic acid-binding Zn ribbon protein
LRAPSPAVLHAVFTRWEEIVGPSIADHAWPVKLQDGVLHLGVEQPAWASQLAFLGPQLVRKVVAATGDETVKKIELRVVARRPK